MDGIDVERKLMREKRCMFKKLRNAILDFNAADASVNVNSTAVKAGSAAAVGTIAATSMVLANNTGNTGTNSSTGIGGLFTKLKGFLKEIFEGVDGIITGATVVVIGLGFLIRILSKNQRTVDEATTWIKRAVLTLIAWKFLGLFLNTIDGAVGQGDAYEWKD